MKPKPKQQKARAVPVFNITNRAEAREFFRWLTEDAGVNFHADDPFECYVNYETGKPCFTPKQCAMLNKAMDQCFEVLGERGKGNIYDEGLKALRKATDLKG